MANNGFSLVGDIFCVTCVVFGALFVLNLMIAVQFNFLDEAFTEIDDQKKKDQEKHEEEMRENRKNVEAIEKENQKDEQEEAKIAEEDKYAEMDKPPDGQQNES